MTDEYRPRKWRTPARGVHKTADGMVKCVIALDRETFDDLRGRAIKEGTSFAEQVRLMVEWGLEVAADE